MPIEHLVINGCQSGLDIRRIRDTRGLTSSRKSIRCGFNSTQILLQLTNGQVVGILNRRIRYSTSQGRRNKVVLLVEIVVVIDIDITDIRRKIDNTRNDRSRSFAHVIGKRTGADDRTERTFGRICLQGSKRKSDSITRCQVYLERNLRRYRRLINSIRSISDILKIKLAFNIINPIGNKKILLLETYTTHERGHDRKSLHTYARLEAEIITSNNTGHVGGNQSTPACRSGVTGKKFKPGFLISLTRKKHHCHKIECFISCFL